MDKTLLDGPGELERPRVKINARADMVASGRKLVMAPRSSGSVKRAPRASRVRFPTFMKSLRYGAMPAIIRSPSHHPISSGVFSTGIENFANLRIKSHRSRIALESLGDNSIK